MELSDSDLDVEAVASSSQTFRTSQMPHTSSSHLSLFSPSLPWPKKIVGTDRTDRTTLLEQYYVDFKEFKYMFVRKCMVWKKYEAYKVWAQWLIRNLCHVTHNYHIMPPDHAIDNDNDIITHLQEKGLETQQITSFYQQIKQYVSQLYQQYHRAKVDQMTHVEQMIQTDQKITCETIVHNGKEVCIYRYGTVFIKYNRDVRDLLVHRYTGDPKCLRFCLFEMGFNYYMLDGHSFQWCLPPKAFGTLEKMLAIKTEFFASPMNACLPRYYSLFHVDRLFGAIDNFFNLDVSTILEGIYEMNPPFIEQIFVESSKMVVDMLQRSQQLKKDLMFVYVMPNWIDSGGYQQLVHSGYLVDELVLENKKHFYYQSVKHRLIAANFETHILVVGTSIARSRWDTGVKSRFMDQLSHY